MKVKGVDLSYCQEGISFPALKQAGVKFAIIRAGFSTKKDVTMDKFVADCKIHTVSVTLENVRAVCAEKSRAGFTTEVKAIITKHGADKLSAIKPEEYAAVLAEVEVLGNAD